MRETLIRSASGAVYIVVLAAAIFFSGFTLYLLFGVFLAIAVREYCQLTRLSIKPSLLLALGFYIWLAISPGTRQSDAIILAIALLGSALALYYLFQSRYFLSKSAAIALLIGYVLMPFVLLVKIPFQNSTYLPENLFSIFILIWVNDTFAYITGKSLGRRKLFEKISPKKTIEGFIGGLTFCVLAGYFLASKYLHQSTALWMSTALVVSVCGTLGDLVESKLKRSAGVKDSGNLMPGHGGILDRLDSVIFATPFVFLLFQIFSYVS